jgi:hypothetical protein
MYKKEKEIEMGGAFFFPYEWWAIGFSPTEEIKIKKFCLWAIRYCPQRDHGELRDKGI